MILSLIDPKHIRGSNVINPKTLFYGPIVLVLALFLLSLLYGEYARKEMITASDRRLDEHGSVTVKRAVWRTRYLD